MPEKMKETKSSEMLNCKGFGRNVKWVTILMRGKKIPIFCEGYNRKGK
jgi:hypothetical protein